MNRILHIVLLTIAATLVGGYVLGAWVVLPHYTSRPAYDTVQVKLRHVGSRKFVSERQLEHHLLSRTGKIVGRSLNELSLRSVEQVMDEHPMVRNSNAYFTPDGRLVVVMEQRVPVLRVMTEGETYFVDDERERMPVISTTASYVPIITGRVSQRMASAELYDFVEMIESDPFWKAQIEQIHVVSPKYIELVPRVGSGVIVLGELTDVERKLKKLKKLYNDGFSAFGWLDYREIDLRFRGQVVCRK